MQEINLTQELDWFDTGTDKIKSISEWKKLGITGKYSELPDELEFASLILPQGRNGPKFLTYSNFEVFFEWNKSFIYVLTAAQFANQLGHRIHCFYHIIPDRNYVICNFRYVMCSRAKSFIRPTQKIFDCHYSFFQNILA